MMYRRFVLWILSVTLIATSAISACASSDIGYTLTRGKLSVMVRFNMIGLYEAQAGKGQIEKVAYAEVSETGRSFLALAKWFYANDAELRKHDFTIIISVVPNYGFDIGYELKNGDHVDVAFTVPYKRGNLIASITAEIDKILKVTTKKDIPSIDRSLYAIYYSPSPSYGLEPDHVPSCGIYMGAFPGSGKWRKIDGEYKVAAICWDDDQGVSDYRVRNGETKTRIQLQRDAVQRALGSIE